MFCTLFFLLFLSLTVKEQSVNLSNLLCDCNGTGREQVCRIGICIASEPPIEINTSSSRCLKHWPAVVKHRSSLNPPQNYSVTRWANVKKQIFTLNLTLQTRTESASPSVHWANCISGLVFSARMTVALPCSVQSVSSLPSVFILDDRCNLSLHEMTGQSIPHYSLQTISSWLRFTMHQKEFNGRDIMYVFFSKAPFNCCLGE